MCPRNKTMNGILMCLSGVAALSFYTPEEFANRCRKFGIHEKDCQGSIYVNNIEYDNFLRSFNLPIHKDPECEKKRCFVSVFRDPPRVFVKSAGDVKCMPSYMCSPESFQSSPGASHMNILPTNGAAPWNIPSMTTTVYQPVPYPVPPSDSTARSASSAKQQTSTMSGRSEQQTTSSSTVDSHTLSMTGTSEDVVTLIRPVYSTVTVDNPITLYREVTTTVLHEVPLTNYKVTTVTEEVPTTRTMEKTISTTETCTKTVSVTSGVSKTIISTYHTTLVSTEYLSHAYSIATTVTQEKPAAAGIYTGAVSSGITMSSTSGYGGEPSISVKTVTETLLGGPTTQKTAATISTLSSVSVSTMASQQDPIGQMKIDMPRLLRPIIEQLSMCRGSVSETSQTTSDIEQKIVFRTTTLPVTETETKTVKKVKTVTRAPAKKDREKAPQTVYNTVYAYKKRKENPAKRPCVPKECLDEKEVVSTVFVYK